MVLETEKTNLKIDSTTGDLVITNGKLVLTSGQEGVIQAADTRLKLFMGEWFLNLREGFPYFQTVYVKNPDLPLIKQFITRTLADVPGIDKESNVLEITTSLNSQTRTLTITWKAQAQFGVISSTAAVGL